MDIAKQLSESGCSTTRHSVKRFLERRGNVLPALQPPSGLKVMKAKKAAQLIKGFDAGRGPVLQKKEIKDAKPFWGFGGPATLDLPKKTGSYTVVGIADHHGAHREQKLLEAQLRVIRDVKPDLVVLLGDEWNFDIISRWQHKMLARLTPLALLKEIRAEIDDVERGILEPVREAAEDALVIGGDANHTDRLRKYISDDLQEGWDTAREWLRVDKYLDHFYTRSGAFIRPGFLVRHGDTTAAYPAAKESRDSRVSGWSGHLHNVNVHYEKPFPLSNQQVTHHVAPASCRLDYNYGSGNAGLARWHQGMLIGSFSALDPHDHVTDVGIWRNGKLRLRGELY